MSIGIVFPSDERLPLVAEDFTSLRDYQATVGGTIEAIGVGEDGIAFFANDEAKLVGLKINRRATLYWWLHLQPEQTYDCICGDAVLVGPANQQGKTLSVPKSLQQLLFTPSIFAVEVKPSGANQWHTAPLPFGDYFAACAAAIDIAQRWPSVVSVRVVAVA